MPANYAKTNSKLGLQWSILVLCCHIRPSSLMSTSRVPWLHIMYGIDQGRCRNWTTRSCCTNRQSDGVVTREGGEVPWMLSLIIQQSCCQGQSPSNRSRWPDRYRCCQWCQSLLLLHTVELSPHSGRCYWTSLQSLSLWWDTTNTWLIHVIGKLTWNI